MIIDLRSDTVTMPSVEMRKAIAEAEVGDAVIDIDPTVDRLERLTAELLGKEAAVYMPSGSMTNQVAIRTHCVPGDEFICDVDCHVYNYEQGAFAQLSGVVARTIEGDAGIIRLDQLDNVIRVHDDHMVRTRMISLENTHNRGAGRIQPMDEVIRITDWARANGLATHMDGARLFNAAVASGVSAKDWSAPFDTVSVCFSKGLGAPVGSALAGPAELITKARRHRKLFGGAMRQAGMIASGAVYALENNIERLSDDHAKAQRIAQTIRETPGLKLQYDQVDTNIVNFQVEPELGNVQQFNQQLEAHGVRMLTANPIAIRAVSHLDVSDEEIDQACGIIQRLALEQLQQA